MVYMTTFAAGSEHSVKYIAEATFGTIPLSPSLFYLRHTGCSLTLSKDAFQSAELRVDRQISDYRHGNKKTQGDINIELSFQEFDPFIAAAMGGSWQNNYAPAGSDIKTSKTGNYIYSSTTTFSSFLVGDVIYATGFSNNDNIYVISSVATTKIELRTVPNAIAATETGSKVVNLVRMSSVRAGTEKTSFTIEREFGDIDNYARFTGCIINSLNLSLKPNSILTGSFNIVGKSSSYATVTLDSTPTDSQIFSPLDAFTGSLYEGDAAVGLITGIDITLDNGANPNFVVGSSFARNVTFGRSNVTGSITAYFQDMTMLNKFINESNSSIEVYIGTGLYGSNSYRIFIPRIKYGTADNSVNDEGPIEMKMDFQALLDSTFNTNIIISSLSLGGTTTDMGSWFFPSIYWFPLGIGSGWTT
jgi:hypothetical protein